ncbi:hypothetical protein ACF1AB_06580 [Streptomyces sp. NPDC014846]|uniref:hypothetical protein n=1 Tax=Streptomyces sp. NPDC014846 TaxID=3364922 RepID=UPI0036FC9063
MAHGVENRSLVARRAENLSLVARRAEHPLLVAHGVENLSLVARWVEHPLLVARWAENLSLVARWVEHPLLVARRAENLSLVARRVEKPSPRFRGRCYRPSHAARPAVPVEHDDAGDRPGALTPDQHRSPGASAPGLRRVRGPVPRPRPTRSPP